LWDNTNINSTTGGLISSYGGNATTWAWTGYTYNVYRDGAKIATVEETSYTDQGFDIAADHTWKVTVVCPADESDPIEITLPACKDCDPVTNLAVSFTETAAIVTWTAVEGAIGYKVSRDGTPLGFVIPTEYKDTHEFEEGTEYTWSVITVCENGESDPVEKKVLYTGIKDFELSSFSIVPNPAQNDITVTAQVPFHTIDVINFLGQAVISQPVEGNTAKLDVSNLTNGVYFVRIASENGTSVKKFVKQ